MKAKIYRPSKTAMQSGRARTGGWVLEYESPSARIPEALMGWTASGDTLNQVKMKFSSREEAERFAREKGLEYTVLQPHERRIKPRNYGDNFKYRPPGDLAKDQEKA